MEWIETTNKNDPLTKYGEYTCYQDWLEMYSKRLTASYTIRLSYENKWVITWWHGNHGHTIDGYKEYSSLDQAKEVCKQHLIKMKESIKI